MVQRTVLVVDDIAFVRKTVSKILTDAHYQVVGEASNGAEAIELYGKLGPSVVVMDVVMPKLSGIEATRRIMKVDKNAKVVIMSALTQETFLMEAISAGAKDYVVKPFQSQDLLRAVEHALFADEEMENRRKAIR